MLAAEELSRTLKDLDQLMPFLVALLCFLRNKILGVIRDASCWRKKRHYCAILRLLQGQQQTQSTALYLHPWLEWTFSLSAAMLPCEAVF